MKKNRLAYTSFSFVLPYNYLANVSPSSNLHSLPMTAANRRAGGEHPNVGGAK
jgi:hypothetical protein